MIRRRIAVEPIIRQVNCDGTLGRSRLKGAQGDAMYSVLCGAGHNLRMILRKLQLLYAYPLTTCIGRFMLVPSVA